MRKLLSHKVSIALYLLLSVFVVCWYSLLNPYLTLVYYEQSQMFQYSWTYFLQHILHPGGWINYCGLFLTQFFHYPLIGIFIYVSVFLLMGWIFQYIIERVFFLQPFRFLAFIPALCMLPVSVDVQFNIAYILAVIIALVGFLLLMQIVNQRYSYLTIPALILVLYLFIGGNVIMSILLFILYSFLFKHQSHVRNVLIIIVSWMIVLVAAWNFYLAPGKEIFFSYTPFNYPDTHHRMFYQVLWFSVILIPLIGFLLRNLKMNPRWTLILNCILLGITIFLSMRIYNPDFERTIKMGYNIEKHNWEDVIKTGDKMSLSPFKCFYMNLALQKSGQLPDKMFHYDQIGVQGLVIDDPQDYTSSYMLSDLFFQLGLMNECIHYAYNSMVGYTYYKEMAVQTVKRLLSCAILQKDDLLIKKYDQYLSNTLFYRNWKKKNKTDIRKIQPVDMRDLLVQGDISHILEGVLKKNPLHQMAFEYLMAYYLLERDYEKAKTCYDRYFSNFNYPSIPVHYAEFLVLYKHLKEEDDHFYDRYPISRDIREQFEMMDVLISVPITKQIQKVLEDRYQNTYWLYVKFPLVNISTPQKNEKTIY